MIKNYLYKIRNFLLPFYYAAKKNYYNKNLQPIFLISANRSGSSIITSILRQHPDLRSVSSHGSNKIIMNNKHTVGFSEDYIWNFLDDPTSDHFRRKNEGFLWSHPKYISTFYKEDFFLKKALYYEIYKEYSEKIPFVSRNFFSLRIKLIKNIFPKAKIIFNIRSYKDYIKSNYDKYKNDKDYAKIFENKLPDIGLHWYMLNSTIYYQLKKYFTDQFYLFNHEKLYDKNFDNQEELQKVTDFLSLQRFNFSFKDVDKKYKFSQEIDFNYNLLNDIKNISEFEKIITENKS